MVQNFKKGKKDPSIVVFIEKKLKQCNSKPKKINACPFLEYPFSGHHPLSPKRYHSVATMFREPTQRLLSSAGMGKYCDKGWSFQRCALFKSQTEKGCYVRSLNGEFCSLKDPSRAPPRCQGNTGLTFCTTKAKSILSGTFLFIGLVERSVHSLSQLPMTPLTQPGLDSFQVGCIGVLVPRHARRRTA